MDVQPYIVGRTLDRALESNWKPDKPLLRRWTFVRVIAAISVLLVGACAYQGWRFHQQYPFGMTHCCDKILASELQRYAERHEGWFPKGESSPEASLSLLYRDDPNILSTLPGKTVPEATVRAIREGGGLLGPTTCGWHYVEGLRSDDDARLGLFWDKVGMNHNGGLLPDGGHYVCRVSGGIDYVPSKDWTAFLIEQTELHKQLKRTPADKSEEVE